MRGGTGTRFNRSMIFSSSVRQYEFPQACSSRILQERVDLPTFWKREAVQSCSAFGQLLGQITFVFCCGLVKSKMIKRLATKSFCKILEKESMNEGNISITNIQKRSEERFLILQQAMSNDCQKIVGVCGDVFGF